MPTMKRPSLQTLETLRRMEKRAAFDLHALARPGSRLLVAISGGPDSVALAHWLRRLPYDLVLAHIDHQIRKNSATDARFVQKLAQKWDIPCVVTRANAPAYAQKHKQSLEEAARNVRYAALSQMARRFHCPFIVTAHTANDQAETVLMNFLRGTGPKGLCGIPASRLLAKGGGRVIRPLLHVQRDEIDLYLQQHSIPYRTDPSNRQTVFTRNWIRRQLLPSLEMKFPGLGARLSQMADIFSQEEDFWQNALSGKPSKQIDLANLFRYHKAASRRKWRLKNPGLSFQAVENSLMKVNGSLGQERNYE